MSTGVDGGNHPPGGIVYRDCYRSDAVFEFLVDQAPPASAGLLNFHPEPVMINDRALGLRERASDDRFGLS